MRSRGSAREAAANKLSSFLTNDRHDTQWKERASVNSDGNRYRVSRLDGLRRRDSVEASAASAGRWSQTSNPIEQVFADLKPCCETEARSYEALSKPALSSSLNIRL